jgi:hypothetical protein
MYTDVERIRSGQGLFQGTIPGIGWAIEENYEIRKSVSAPVEIRN